MTAEPPDPDVDERTVDHCRAWCSEQSRWLYPPQGLDEPPDGTRLEVVYNTDRYGAWRDVAASVEAGWPADECWTLYPQTVPHSWYCMQRTFGSVLATATRLYPEPGPAG